MTTTDDIFKSIPKIRHSLVGIMQVSTSIPSQFYRILKKKLVEKIECSKDVRTDGRRMKIRIPFPIMGVTKTCQCIAVCLCVRGVC